MGTISLEHSSRLYWLGRYAERTFSTLLNLQKLYDRMIDMGTGFTDYLYAFGLENNYENSSAFLRSFLYDENNPDSVAYSLERAYDNGIVLRETISSEALSFLQMAKDTLYRSQHSGNIRLSLLPLKDIFYSFWGCVMDHVFDEEAWNLIFCGKSMERTMLLLRLQAPYTEAKPEFNRLCRRLRFVPEGTPYRSTPERLELLTEIFGSPEQYAAGFRNAVTEMEHLFEVSA
ncbi:MAG: alpha-E domain-containing protein [Oscillospiraceae bacterium]|nr:alpha-E domain-containing protein [Oscillospiraceae bacterium]